MTNWLDKELLNCNFKDERLKKRFLSIISSLHANYGKTIPQIFQDWSTTKSMYRFLSNERVDEHEILSSHFEKTQERITNTVHDTTEFSYKRKHPELIGYTRKSPYLNKSRKDIPQEYKVCGVLMHASLAVTSEGLPLGLTSTRFWSRKVFKGTEQLKRHINPTRIPIEEKESIRWLNNLEFTMNSTSENSSKIIHIGVVKTIFMNFFPVAMLLIPIF